MFSFCCNLVAVGFVSTLSVKKELGLRKLLQK